MKSKILKNFKKEKNYHNDNDSIWSELKQKHAHNYLVFI